MTVKLKYLRFTLLSTLFVLHFAALIATFLFDNFQSYSAWVAWALFFFSWMQLGIALHNTKSAESRSNNANPETDDSLLKLQFWAGYVGAFLAASALLGLALN